MPRTRPERYSDPLRGTRTRGETARLIGCSINGVDPLIEAGPLVAVIVGNRRLITVTSIEKLLGRKIHELEAATPVAAPKRPRGEKGDRPAA